VLSPGKVRAIPMAIGQGFGRKGPRLAVRHGLVNSYGEVMAEKPPRRRRRPSA
jgi:hypothetical protein